MKQTAVEWLVEKIQQANPTFKQILIKIGKHILALPTYPFFALSYVLKKLDNIIDYCLSIYLSIIKKIIK